MLINPRNAVYQIYLPVYVIKRGYRTRGRCTVFWDLLKFNFKTEFSRKNFSFFFFVIIKNILHVT
jgi:hypothetical protein